MNKPYMLIVDGKLALHSEQEWHGTAYTYATHDDAIQGASNFALPSKSVIIVKAITRVSRDLAPVTVEGV